MPVEDILIDGVSLKTFAINIDSIAATLKAPALRTKNVESLGRDGLLFSDYKRYGANVLVWNLWMRGADKSTGQIPQGYTARKKFYENMDTLLNTVAVSHRELTIIHIREDGTQRRAKGQVTNVLDWSVIGVDPLGKVSLEITMADPFWYDTFLTYQSFFTNATLNNQYVRGGNYSGGIHDTGATELYKFRGMTAPLQNFILDLRGPFTTCQIRSGEYICTVSQAATSGEIIRLFNGNWILRRISVAMTALTGNRVPNPSFEYTLSGNALPNHNWAITGVATGIVDVETTGARPGVTAKIGSKYGVVTAGSTGLLGMRTSVAIGAATFLNAYAELQMVGATRTAEIFVEYYQAGGAFISSTTIAGTACPSGVWTRQTTGALTTPALTARADITYRVAGAVSGEKLLLDAAMAQGTASLAVPYFDGDTDTFSGWSGQVGNSVSHSTTYADTPATMSDTSGTVVDGSLVATGGTVRLMEIPKDIRQAYGPSFGATPEERIAAAPILPPELSLVFTGSPTSTTGARLQAYKPYLTG